MYPVDLLKVSLYLKSYRARQEDSDTDMNIQQTRLQVVNPTPAAIYTGIGNAISTISRAEGYMSLWRGLSSVVVGAGKILILSM